MRILQRIPNQKPRRKLSASMRRDVRLAIESAAQEMDCSKSFIMEVACASFFGIKGQESLK